MEASQLTASTGTDRGTIVLATKRSWIPPVTFEIDMQASDVPGIVTPAIVRPSHPFVRAAAPNRSSHSSKQAMALTRSTSALDLATVHCSNSSTRCTARIRRLGPFLSSNRSLALRSSRCLLSRSPPSFQRRFPFPPLHHDLVRRSSRIERRRQESSSSSTIEKGWRCLASWSSTSSFRTFSFSRLF